MEKFFIKLSNNWFQKDKEGFTLLDKLDSNCLLIYSIMLRDLTVRGTIKFNILDICNTLHIKKTNTRMIDKIKTSILKMNNILFDIYIDSNCKEKLSTYKIDNTNIYYALVKKPNLENNFFILYDKEINKIILEANKKKKSKDLLIAQYCYIVKSLGGDKKESNYKVCKISLKTISKYTNINTNTILKNNKIFIDLNLLLINNAGVNIINDNIKDTSNIYARTEDKKYFEKFLKEEKNRTQIKYKSKQSKNLMNKQRQLKQKINKFKKINNIETVEDIHSIKLWEQLNLLERQYADFILHIRNKKIKRGSNLLTIKTTGENKKYLI